MNTVSAKPIGPFETSRQQETVANSAVERIANLTPAARTEQLTPEVRRLFKRSILDSIGRAIAALPGPPFRALREQFKEYRAPGCCTLIGGKTSVDQAALFNSGLTRYVDVAGATTLKTLSSQASRRADPKLHERSESLTLLFMRWL